MISGKSGHGKDQFADFLKRNLEIKHYRTMIIHFGDPVKWFASQYFNYKGTKDIEDRTILQTLGTDIVRKRFPDYWAKIIAKFVAAIEDEYDFIIIPDLRFINELLTVKKYNKNIVSVRIDRFNPDGTYYINPNLTEEQRNHISECELDDYCCDWEVANDGTLDTLDQTAYDLMEELII